MTGRRARHALGAIALALMAMLGGPAAAKTLCGGEAVRVTLDKAGLPIAHLSLAGRDSDFLIDTGSSISIVNAARFGVRSGERVPLKDFSLPTVSGGTFAAWDWVAHDLNIVGSDILRTRTLEISYDGPEPYIALSDKPCPSEDLVQAGFVRIDQRGYYGARTGAAKPGLPVVFVRIGKTTRPFYLDTGRGDFVDGGMLAVNVPFMKLLKDEMVPFRHYGIGHISDCQENDTLVDVVWTNAVRMSLLTRPGGDEVAVYDSPPLMILPEGALCAPPQAATQPFGLIGSSFLRLWGQVVIDPFEEAVWIRTGPR